MFKVLSFSYGRFFYVSTIIKVSLQVNADWLKSYLHGASRDASRTKFIKRMSKFISRLINLWII